MIVRVLVAITAIFFYATQVAVAQNPHDDPVPLPPTNPIGQGTYNQAVAPGSGISGAAQCTSGQGCENRDAMLSAIQGGPVQEGAYWLPPATGLRDTMESKALVNRDTELLTTPKGLLNTTWMMLEPGIATGMHAARVESELTEQNHYLSQLAYLQQMALVGEEATMDAYQGCMVRLAKQGKPWIEQIAFCQKDVGKAQAGYANLPDQNAGAKLSHTLGYEGPAAAGASATPAPLPTSTTISLWESLFRQVGLAGTMGSTLPNLADYMKQHFGDVRFDWVDGTLMKSNANAARTDKLLSNFYEANYKMLLDVMIGYCQDTNNKKTATAAAHDPWAATNEDFWTQMAITPGDMQGGIPQHKLFWNRLSLFQVRFTPGIGEGLWKLWSMRYTADAVLPCVELENAKNDLSFGELKVQPGQVNEHLIAWKIYSALLARGHTIEFAQKWLSLLNRLPFTPSSTLLKEARTLILQQTKVQDPDAESARVADELVRLIQNVFCKARLRERRVWQVAVGGYRQGQYCEGGSGEQCTEVDEVVGYGTFVA